MTDNQLAAVTDTREPLPEVLLERVGSGLLPLTFDSEQDRRDKTPDEMAYLRHYGLIQPDSLTPVSHCMGTFASGDFQLATHYWLPESPRGTYLLVHGYFDHVGLYGHLIHYLLQRGYAVVAFDLPGHGLSSGERVSIDSFDRYVDVFSDLLQKCVSSFPRPWKGIGQSTGGAILMKYVMAAKPYHYPNDLTSVTVLAPLIRPREWMKSLRTYKLFHRVLKKVSRTFRPNTTNEAFNEFLINNDPLQYNYIPIEWVASMKRWTEEFAALPPSDYPLKVVQGDCDGTVDWRYNVASIRKKFPNFELVLIPGARHHLVNEVDYMRDQVFKSLGEG